MRSRPPLGTSSTAPISPKARTSETAGWVRGCEFGLEVRAEVVFHLRHEAVIFDVLEIGQRGGTAGRMSRVGEPMGEISALEQRLRDFIADHGAARGR